MASRFFVSPGFRLDGGNGSSRGSSTGGLSAFPKLNFSWLAVDRQDQPPLWGIISQLRPRLALGIAGTQPSPESKLRVLNPGGNPPTLYLDDTTIVPGVFVGGLGNTQLHPERSQEIEGGFDATLWQNRLSLTYTQYHKMRHDAILSTSTAPSVGNLFDPLILIHGYGGIAENIGDVLNTGQEVTLNVIPIQRRALSWTMNANLSHDHNKVVHLAPDLLSQCLRTCDTRIVPGYPLASTWAQSIVSYGDANGDGIIEAREIRLADSAVYIGAETPNYQVNVATDVSLLNGQLSVHGTFAYTNGLTQYNQASVTSNAFTLLPNTPGTTLATQAAIVAAGNGNGFGVGGSIFGLVQTVNTFRFQDLSVNYRVPARVSNWFRVPQMSIALQGSNLGLHTNYRGKDPNVNAFSTNSGEATRDSGQIPQPRTWWLRVNLGS
jgi:hypothetical protein